MKSVQHRNIICMKEIFDSSDKLYIVLELVRSPKLVQPMGHSTVSGWQVTGGELFDRIVSKGSYSERARRRRPADPSPSPAHPKNGRLLSVLARQLPTEP